MGETSKAKSMMMGFFTVLGIIVAGGFVLIVIYGIYAASSFISPFHERESTSLVKTLPKESGESQSKIVYTFGRPSKMGNFMVSRLSIAHKAKFSGLSSSSDYYGWGKTINYLFLDPASGKSHWLWKQSLPLVLDEHNLVLRTEQKKKIRPEKDFGLLVTLAEKDTNDDRSLSEDDEVTLAVIKPDGHTVLHLLKNLTRVSSVTPIDESKVLLIYEKKGKTYSAMYNPKTYTISLEQVIPQVVIH